MLMVHVSHTLKALTTDCYNHVLMESNVNTQYLPYIRTIWAILPDRHLSLLFFVFACFTGLKWV